jgi:C4-dicarboxylate transporter DctM subunit
MRRRGYSIDFSASTLAAAGVLGPIIPPSIMMIVLATCSPVPLSVEDLFIGGVAPGLIMSVGMMLHAWRFAKKNGEAYREQEAFSLSRLGRTALSAVPAFFMPVIIVGGIIGGIFTPTEAAAVAVFAGFLIGIFIYHELKWREIPRILVRSACVSASIMMIIATASVFSWLIASNRIPELMARQMLALSSSAWVFLLLLNVLLFIIGMFMESNSAILILIPVVMPVAVHNLGIDPVHLGVLVTCNLCVGMITPPYGICLFVASSISGRTIAQLNRHIWGFVIVLSTVLILMTYVPPLVTWLPSLLH